MKCTKCGNESRWLEKISRDIEQEVRYEDGYIVEERTKYKKNGNSVAVCRECGAIYEEYDL